MKMIPSLEVGDNVIDEVSGSNPRHVFKVVELLPDDHKVILVGNLRMPFKLDTHRLHWSDDPEMWVAK